MAIKASCYREKDCEVSPKPSSADSTIGNYFSAKIFESKQERNCYQTKQIFEHLQKNRRQRRDYRFDDLCFGTKGGEILGKYF